jgi:hypothetical protein
LEERRLCRSSRIMGTQRKTKRRIEEMTENNADDDAGNTPDPTGSGEPGAGGGS